MSAADFDRLRDLLLAALDEPEVERERFLRERCGDPALLRAALSLLRHDSASGVMPDDEVEEQPATIGRYPVSGRLGAGGMGVVYLGTDPTLERPVAIKRLPAWVVASAPAMDRFREEARLLARLNHPNIATVYSLETDDQRAFLTMEHIEGEPLSSRVGACGIDTTLSIVRQLASALEGAHARGVVHRDLKPQNVMVTPDDRVKVLDFGLARLIEPGRKVEAGTTRATGRMAERSTSGSAVSWSTAGTPGYMSPERIRGEEDDVGGDIWALGCVLFECFAGRRAFEGDGEERLRATLEGEVPLDALPSDVPAAVRALIARCLAPGPAQRLRTARAARRTIETAVEAREMERLRHELETLSQRSAVPERLTRFFGRERELADVEAALARGRLVTLVGLGGSGKTRLAGEVARGVEAAGDRPVVWVDLAAMTDARGVATSCLAALGEHTLPDDPAALVCRRLASTRALVVLDNCEPVAAVVAELVRALSAAAPEVRLLATSREQLDVEGEQLYAVPPLVVPDTSVPGAETSEAVRLFVDRACAVRPGFALTKANRAALLGICRRLDGLPLALEIAASQMHVLEPDELEERLIERLRLTRPRAGTVDARQASLQSVIGWSVERLAADEMRMFRRLSVLVGTWTLGAAEAVGIVDTEERWRALDLLSALLRVSLVQRAPASSSAGGGRSRARYRMLETVREYANARLAETEEEDAAREAAFHYYSRLFQRADTTGSRQEEWVHRYLEEEENLGEAITRAPTARVSAAEAGALCARVCKFWIRLGRWSEARERLAAARERLDGEGADETPLYVQLLRSEGDVARAQGDLDAASRLCERALPMAEALGNLRLVGAVLTNLGNVERLRGDLERALDFIDRRLALGPEVDGVWDFSGVKLNRGVVLATMGRWAESEAEFLESLELKRKIDDVRGVSHALNALGTVARFRGDLTRATELYEESLEMKRRVDDRPGIVNTALNLGKVTLDRFRTLEEDRERLEHAKAWFHEGLALAEEIGDQPSSVNHLHALATVAQLEGDLCEARRLCERSLDLSRAFGGLTYEAWSLTGLALVDIEEGRFADAWRRCLSGLELFRRANVADSHEPLGILAGAAAGLERREDAVLLVAAGFARAEDSGVEMPPLTRRRLEGLRDELRDVVDEETFVRLWAEGRDIGADALIAQLAADA